MNCSWHECGRMGGVVESEKGNVKKGGAMYAVLGGGGSASGSWVLDGSRGFCLLGFLCLGACGFLWFLRVPWVRLFADR
jgi:hypothetical protein